MSWRGLLSLSWVVSPVYLAALGLPAAVEVAVCLARRQDLRRTGRGLGLAALGLLVTAGPWWYVSGSKAVDYLLGSGYGSEFTVPGASLQQNLLHRLERTVAETGLVISLTLVAGLAVTLWLDRRQRRSYVPVATSVLGLALLGTSSNVGTAFALPLVVLLSVTVGAVLLASRARRAGWLRTGLGAALLLGIGGQFGLLPQASPAGQPLWVVAYPGRQFAASALGVVGAVPDGVGAKVEQAQALVVRLAQGRRLLVLRDDQLVNSESVAFWTRKLGYGPTEIQRTPYASATVTAADLQAADVVLAGHTAEPLHSNLNLTSLDRQLRGAGWTPVAVRVFSGRNDLTLWVRARVP